MHFFRIIGFRNILGQNKFCFGSFFKKGMNLLICFYWVF